jgi:very-short-patch-repair endonuclease
MVELIWDGKYKDGQRTAPPKLKLPFQTVETVNESARQRQLSFEAMLSGQPTDWRNRLIWGDKKYVLPALLDDLAGQVDLIYIDPPFATGADFSFQVEVEDERFTKEASIIEQKAYRDTWGRGLDSYLQWFYETVVMLRELLAEHGSIYVHLDWHIGHYAKIILDEVFGAERFINEVVWVRSSPRANIKIGMSGGHDVILIYSKTESPIWNKQFGPLSDEYVKSHYNRVEEGTGRLYRTDNMISPNPDRPNLKYEWNGIIRVWRVTKENMQKLHDAGRLVYSGTGVAQYKRYLDESEGTPLSTAWQDIPPVNSQAVERVEYRTQKPEALLERIIQASSNPGDLVLDCFCLRAGSLVRVVEAPPNPPVDGGEQHQSPREREIQHQSPRLRGDLGGQPVQSAEIGGEQNKFSCERGIEAPPNPPVDGGEQHQSPRSRGDLGGPANYLPIEQIRPGDWVIGHDGQAHQVRQTHQREYQGQIIGLQRKGSNQTLWLTADHRVLCQKRPIILKPPPSTGGIKGGQPSTGGIEGERKKDWSHVSPPIFARSQELRKQSTAAEKKLWQALQANQLGLAFRRQHPLGPYIADFYSRQAGLVIEVDGESHTTPQAQAYDAQRTAWITQAGLRVMRFWNNEVIKNLPGVVQTIQTHLQQTTAPGYPDKEWRRAEELQVSDIIFYDNTLEPAEISRLHPENTTETVFDLTVEGTHSFLTDVCLVHNCGSGTTAATAEKLGRRWLTCDLGRFAIHTARKRLLSIDNVRPFVVQNLGKYERQAWQAAEFGGAEQAAQITAAYRRFILDLYNARPITGYAWLHGLKAGRMVHVGAVDSPISPADVKQIAIEFHKATGTGANAPSQSAVDVLGWDFAFELNEVARQQAAEANIAMRFVRIPREVLEKKAVEQGDIKFFELAALAVEAAQEGRGVNLTLADFVIPPDDVPAEVQAAISHWSQWIDYWAVDWDNQGDTFHNMWQTYRTRQSKSLGLKAGHKYQQPGRYVIMVKVIDILGNDTTKTLKVEVQ